MSKYYEPEKGAAAEELFYKLAVKKYKQVRKSTLFEDRNGHYDFIIKYNNHPLTKTKRVEVKSIKGFSKKHPKQEEWLWVEFKNVTGNLGWLKGKADLIAFELKDKFIIVDREDLLRFSLKTVDFVKEVTCSKDSKYRIFRPRGGKDEKALVKTIDVIKNCKYSVWNKI